MPLRQNVEEKVQGKELKKVWDDVNERNTDEGYKTEKKGPKGIEIHISDVFAIIKPTGPFKLGKHQE